MSATDPFSIALNFLTDIGLQIQYAYLREEDCFLPGLQIWQGSIVIDKLKLKFPGDIIHEAAHLAVVPAQERKLLNGADLINRKDREAEEMMAIAWSYAVCRHLDIDPGFVFHEHGYQKGGNEIVENFNAGRYFGVPVLEWLGMTSTQCKDGGTVYPAMIKWLRD